MRDLSLILKRSLAYIFGFYIRCISDHLLLLHHLSIKIIESWHSYVPTDGLKRLRVVRHSDEAGRKESNVVALSLYHSF